VLRPRKISLEEKDQDARDWRKLEEQVDCPNEFCSSLSNSVWGFFSCPQMITFKDMWLLVARECRLNTKDIEKKQPVLHV
jgi:hypothetical protein